MRPSAQLAAILSGQMQPSDADDAVQSWLRLSVYQMAKSVLRLPKEARRAQLDGITEGLRGMVESEVIRIHGGNKKCANTQMS